MVPAPETLRTGTKNYWVERQCQDGTYRLELEESTVDDYTYLDFTRVEREGRIKVQPVVHRLALVKQQSPEQRPEEASRP